MLSEAKVKPDGHRHLKFALWRSHGDEIINLKPTEFALWEGCALIEDYDISLPANPASLVIGFIAPRFVSTADSYGNAVMLCLKRCLTLKRPDDWWRIDRYAIEAYPVDPAAPLEKSVIPYDDSLVTVELKQRHYFHSDAGHLENAIDLPVRRDRAAADVREAIERQCDAMDKCSGKRHLFLFVHNAAMEMLDDPEILEPLREMLSRESVTLHAICVDSSEKCTGLRELCLSMPDGTFRSSSADRLADEFQQIYKQLLNRYRIDYALPVTAPPAQARLQICSDYGVGRAEFPLD